MSALPVGSADSRLLPPILSTTVGRYRLKRPKSARFNPSARDACTSPFRGGVDDVLPEDRGHFIRGAVYLFSYSPRGSKCFPGEVWGGAFFKKAASPAFPRSSLPNVA